MARRSYTLKHGEGSFYQRADGKWVGVLEAGWTTTGSRRRVTITRTDKDECWDELTAQRKALALTGHASTASPTVKSWSARWLEQVREEYAPQGFAQRESHVRRWIVPTIGRRKLDAVTPAHIREIHAALREAGCAPTTIRNVHATVALMFRAAAIEGYQVPQPVLLMRTPPGGRTVTREAILGDDALELVRVASSRPDAARWIAALLQGMRQGECLGLTWDAINFKRNTIDVSWQLVDIRYADRDARTFAYPPDRDFVHLAGTRHLSRPKSNAGQRIIPMVPWMRDALEQWRDVAPSNPWGLVWGAKGRPLGPGADRENWNALCDEAEVWKRPGKRGPDGGWLVEPERYVLHEARHTAASILLAAGVAEEVVKQIMGHSTVAMSRHYQHADQEQMLKALNASASILQLGAG